MDRNLKMGVINDAFNIVVPNDWQDDNGKKGANTSKDIQVGNFSLIIDENSAEPGGKSGRVEKGGAQRKGINTMWR